MIFGDHGDRENGSVGLGDPLVARALYHGAGFQPCAPFGGYPPSDENNFMTLVLG